MNIYGIATPKFGSAQPANTPPPPAPKSQGLEQDTFTPQAPQFKGEEKNPDLPELDVSNVSDEAKSDLEALKARNDGGPLAALFEDVTEDTQK
jgi:hypothetical protein